MTTIVQSDPRWFESWRNPREFFRAAREQGALVPLCKPLLRHLREAYVAGLFAQILNDNNPCSVRLVPTNEEPPDFQIKQSENTLGFENVIADRPNRRMWDDHRKWDKTLKSGEIVHTETSVERQQVLEAISQRIEEKFVRYKKREIDTTQINLLVYLNISPKFLVEEIASYTKAYKETFQSVWLLSGGNAVRVWPEQQVLSTQHDPLE